MGASKDNQSDDQENICVKVFNKITSFIKKLPWNGIKKFAIPSTIIFFLSFYTKLFNPSLWIFQSLSVRDTIELLKFSLPPNETCFIDYNNFVNDEINTTSIVDYKNDIHVIILDGLKVNKNFLSEQEKKYGNVFSSYHTIGSDKNKRITNFLNGKSNFGCVREDDELLLTNIFEKKGYQVKTFIDNTFDNNILCTNKNNYIDKVESKPEDKSNSVSKKKPSFSLSILSGSSNNLKQEEVDKKIENILNYQDSSFNNSYVILIINDNIIYYNPYLMISLPLNIETNEYNNTLLHNLNESLTSYDLYKTLTNTNNNNTFVNIFTTPLSQRSCQQMIVPIENCRCQSYFFKLPNEMVKVRKILIRNFVRNLKDYFNSSSQSNNNCIERLNQKEKDIKVYYALISPKKGIHFKMALKLNDKRKVMAFYNDRFFIISQGIINIGEDNNC